MIRGIAALTKLGMLCSFSQGCALPVLKMMGAVCVLFLLLDPNLFGCPRRDMIALFCTFETVGSLVPVLNLE